MHASFHAADPKPAFCFERGGVPMNPVIPNSPRKSKSGTLRATLWEIGPQLRHNNRVVGHKGNVLIQVLAFDDCRVVKRQLDLFPIDPA